MRKKDTVVVDKSVEKADSGLRLDVFVFSALPKGGISRGAVQEWIRQGLVRLDGRVCEKPSRKLAAGQRVHLEAAFEPPGIRPSHAPLAVLHEDAHVAVLEKEAGLAVHPAPGLDEETLVHRLVHRYPEIASMDGERPGLVHRLDRDTSGVMVAARSETARQRLAKAFECREVVKVYLALVHGVPERNRGEIDLPLGRDPVSRSKMAVVRDGRTAKSSWRLLWSDYRGDVSLVAVRIHTGRTHQIRVHLAAVGHPVLGDTLYGPREQVELARRRPRLARLASRQMLHAAYLRFRHPATGAEEAFVSPPPKDFRRIPLMASRKLLRAAVTGMPGSGKSLFCAMLAEQGVPVFSADACVAKLYEPGADGWTLLRRRFGDDLAPEDGPVDKAALFFAMRESEAMRREIMDTIHPLVFHRIERFWEIHERRRLAAAEIPLLFESGREDAADVAVFVSLARESRLAFLAARGVAEDVAGELESWQMDEDEKRLRCDLVAENPGDEEGLAREARRIHAELRAVSARRIARMKAVLDAIWTCRNLPLTGEDEPA